LSSEKTTVLITGVGGGSYGHELLKALKLTGRYRLVGVDMAPSSFGLFDVDVSYLVPAASDPSYVDILLGICAEHDVRVVIHGSDPELAVLSARRDEFISAGVLPLVNTAEIIGLCLDKWETIGRLAATGAAVPVSALVGEHDPLPDIPLPAVIKPRFGGGGSNNVFLAQSLDELEEACLSLRRQGKEAVVQEYIGTVDDEYTVGVLHTLDGSLVNSLALNRTITSGFSSRIKVANRTPRTELGPTLIVSSGLSQGVVRDFPEVRAACEAITNALGSRGPLNVQVRVSEGRVYPFEINPRFSGTSYMRALLGFNEADLLIRHHVLGEAIPERPPYRTGHVVRALAERVVEDYAPVTSWSPRA
jgi:carbamoyl-phosphate synthase large subunit